MDYQLNLYDGSYNVAGSDEHVSSDGIWHPRLFFNPNYSQEEFLQGLLSSSCGREGADFSSSQWNEDELVEETYEGEEQLPNYGCGNWLSEYGHSFGHCWGDEYFSLGNGIHNNEDGSQLKKVEEDSGQCEQQYECNSGHEEVTQEDYPTCDSWSYDSWFACGGKIDSHCYNEQESRTSHSYYPPEIGVWESIFGYWPCLYRF
jgi:hypothetical protein